MSMNTEASLSFDKFWAKQKKNIDSLMTDFQYRLAARWGEIVHMTSIINKWTQRVAQGTVEAAGIQQLMVGVQIAQMGVAITMLTGQAAAAFLSPLPGARAYGLYLMSLAGDMTMELIFLTTQREAAKAAKHQAESQAAAIKKWRESYN